MFARAWLKHSPAPALPPSPRRQQDKLLDRPPGAFGGHRGGRREAGLLAAACEAYAAETRRLLPSTAAERLAAQFEALQGALQPLVGGFRPVGAY